MIIQKKLALLMLVFLGFSTSKNNAYDYWELAQTVGKCGIMAYNLTYFAKKGYRFYIYATHKEDMLKGMSIGHNSVMATLSPAQTQNIKNIDIMEMHKNMYKKMLAIAGLEALIATSATAFTGYFLFWK